jgi:mannose-6-phosphate isomerase-like protein (cupin superfamily)
MSTHGNASLTPDSLPRIARLNDWALQPAVLAALRAAQAEAVAKLAREPGLRSTFVSLDPGACGAPAPAGIATLRVAVSRAGADTAVERHPNSDQYLFVLDGPVETHVETPAGWRIDRYGEGSVAVLENRWHLVPQGVWHKSNAPGPHDCTVVALHTAQDVKDEFRA